MSDDLTEDDLLAGMGDYIDSRPPFRIENTTDAELVDYIAMQYHIKWGIGMDDRGHKDTDARIHRAIREAYNRNKSRLVTLGHERAMGHPTPPDVL